MLSLTTAMAAATHSAAADRNLKVWRLADGELLLSLHQKTFTKDAWPSVQFTAGRCAGHFHCYWAHAAACRCTVGLLANAALVGPCGYLPLHGAVAGRDAGAACRCGLILTWHPIVPPLHLQADEALAFHQVTNAVNIYSAADFGAGKQCKEHTEGSCWGPIAASCCSQECTSTSLLRA